ncbi:DnaJ domain containing protein [Hyaloscypha variabilis]
MASTPDHYKVLGLKRNCTEDDITRAYQEPVLLYHPAKNPGCKMSEEKIKEITTAYEILADPMKRRAYNAATSQLRPQARPFQPGNEQTPASSTDSVQSQTQSFSDSVTAPFLGPDQISRVFGGSYTSWVPRAFADEFIPGRGNH